MRRNYESHFFDPQDAAKWARDHAAGSFCAYTRHHGAVLVTKDYGDTAYNKGWRWSFGVTGYTALCMTCVGSTHAEMLSGYCLTGCRCDRCANITDLAMVHDRVYDRVKA